MIAELVETLMRSVALTIDPVHPRDPALARLFGNARTHSGVHVDEQKVLGYPAVWRALNILTNVHHRSRPLIYERTHARGRDGKRRATEHPSYRAVTRQAWPDISAANLRQTIHWHALAWGNGYAAIDRDPATAAIRGMVPLLPDRTYAVRVQGGQVLIDDGREEQRGELMVATRVGGQWRRILPENVVHLRGLTHNGIVGVPVVEVLAESLGLGMALAEFSARFFGQGSVMSGMIEIPQGLKPDAQARFEASVKDAHQGLGRSHMIMILEEGAKFTPTAIPPNHAQFIESREFEIRNVALAIGVQSHKLFDPARKSFASLEQSNQEHLDDDLDPWLGRIEEELSDKCLTEREKDEDSHFIEFNRHSLVRTNLAARTAHYSSGRQWGWLSANDVRAAENMTDIGPEGDTYLTPGNMLPADSQEPPDPEPPAAALTHDATHDADGQLAELAGDYLDRVWRRLANQAQARASRGSREFCGWLDDLEPTGPIPAAVHDSTHTLFERVQRDLQALTLSCRLEQLPAHLTRYFERGRPDEHAYAPDPVRA